MKVMLVEPNGSGHHMALYVRYVTRKLLDEGCELSLLTTRSAIAHPSFHLLRAELGRDVETHFLPELPVSETSSSIAILVSQIKTWFILRRSFAQIHRQVKPDIVYVPTLDWVAKGMELLGSPFGKIPFIALYVSPKHHRKTMGLGPSSRQDWLYDKLFRRLLRIQTLRSLLVIDELFLEFCKTSYDYLADKVRYVPDFGEIRGEGTKDECRAALGIPKEAKVLLVYGSLTKRKGIIQLLEAFSGPAAPSEMVLLLAGKADQEIQEIMETPSVKQLTESGRIITRLSFHNNNEEYRAFKASDYVWLGYVSGFYGSSGVLYQSLSAGRSLISMEAGLIGHLVQKYQLGVTVNPNSKASIERGLRNAMYLDQEFGSGHTVGKLESYSSMHHHKVHTKIVFETLKEFRVKSYE